MWSGGVGVQVCGTEGRGGQYVRLVLGHDDHRVLRVNDVAVARVEQHRPAVVQPDPKEQAVREGAVDLPRDVVVVVPREAARRRELKHTLRPPAVPLLQPLLVVAGVPGLLRVLGLGDEARGQRVQPRAVARGRQELHAQLVDADHGGGAHVVEDGRGVGGERLGQRIEGATGGLGDQGCIGKGGKGGREVLEGKEGGSWNQFVCVLKMARQDVPNGKFRFFRLAHFGLGGGGVQGETPLLRWCTAILILPWGPPSQHPVTSLCPSRCLPDRKCQPL